MLEGWTPVQDMVPHGMRSAGQNAHLHARGVEAKRVAQRRGARGEHRQQRVCIAAREPLQPLQRGLQPAQGQCIWRLKSGNVMYVETMFQRNYDLLGNLDTPSRTCTCWWPHVGGQQHAVRPSSDNKPPLLAATSCPATQSFEGPWPGQFHGMQHRNTKHKQTTAWSLENDTARH